MRLGICSRTNREYVVIFVIFLGTMIVFSYLGPRDDLSSNKTGYAYEQSSSEQALSALLPLKSMAVTHFKNWYDEQKDRGQLSDVQGVKITSPAKDQNVPVGELQISGTSADNAATNCQVLVDVNDIKPFQKAIATGPDGQNDYSSWSFKYTDAYHLITEGSNELTAKLSCSDKNIKPKWYSVNITGVANPDKDIKPKLHTVNTTEAAKKPAPGNILFTTVASNESSSLPSNKTLQGSPAEEQKIKIANPEGVNKTTTNSTTTNSTDSPYPDVLLQDEVPDELINATNELSIAADPKTTAGEEPSALKVKKATTTPTDSPYPDVLLEEEPDEVGEEPEMRSQLQGQQDGQQELSTAGDEKLSAIKVQEDTTTAKDVPDVLLEDESINDKEEEVKEDEVEDVEEQPEMKSSLQTFDTDDEQKVTANEQLHLGQTDDHVMDSAEDTYTTIMSNLDKSIDDDIPSGYDMHDYAFKK
jgi:hypothetical protein